MVSNIFYVHPYLGKIPILTNIFQLGWNHQPEKLIKPIVGGMTIPERLLTETWDGDDFPWHPNTETAKMSFGPTKYSPKTRFTSGGMAGFLGCMFRNSKYFQIEHKLIHELNWKKRPGNYWRFLFLNVTFAPNFYLKPTSDMKELFGAKPNICFLEISDHQKSEQKDPEAPREQDVDA